MRLRQFKPGFPGHQKCTAMKRDGTPCGKIALSGLKVCGAHGGYAAKARQGLYVAKHKRVVFVAEDLGLAPRRSRDVGPDRRDLLAMPIWREPLRHGTRARLAVAYDKRVSEPEAWRAMLRQAQAELAGDLV